MDKTTTTSNTSQDYLNFLMEVLRKVVDDPKSQLIYPFLAQNQDKLDENLIKVLDNRAKNTLSSVDTKESEYITFDIFTFSAILENFSIGSITTNKEIALSVFTVVDI